MVPCCAPVCPALPCRSPLNAGRMEERICIKSAGQAHSLQTPPLIVEQPSALGGGGGHRHRSLNLIHEEQITVQDPDCAPGAPAVIRVLQVLSVKVRAFSI